MVAIPLPTESISRICRQFHVREMALFGSVLRQDFRPDSDIDILVTFDPQARIDLFDLAQLKESLEELFGRPVDLVEKAAVRNPFRKKQIFGQLEVIYAA
ncbi:MAG TPA: nucleotidyltransferase family protein [Anaerohalosphaeraceae bacterium]|nr:nucleotidyltransferase family protein [Anaerohalosphaeraceae bacterium]HOL88155.1 nucleotidyltransferase family protein [Anaerohalosphaeraceae bacterium]HPP56015.1 nucleotidyltransferase family protein [Anaerohalosphaeraceae bacterium]